jgi:hypothetical protein
MRAVRGVLVAVAALGMGVLVAAPSTSAQQQPSAIILWDERRPLAWDDFRATPDPNNGAVALVFTGFTATSFSCLREGGRARLSDGGMLANMEPAKSWVKPVVRGNAEVLAHEQGHFNITEYFARRIRMMIRATDCTGRSFDAVANEIGQKFNQLHGEWQSTQVRYDQETDHHNNRPKQREWNDLIRRQLEETKDQ